MIAIIDYGMGNLRSVQKAFEKVGAQAQVTSDSFVILKADKVVLPGVGAMAPAMDRLRELGLFEVIGNVIDDEKPFLGICLGMQLLFEQSEEGGKVVGLCELGGSVKRFKQEKVPHMGWNQINFDKDCPMFKDIKNGSDVYFCHSYFVDPQFKDITASKTNYGIDFVSSVCRDNIWAVQFHPEKSQTVGLQILKNFTELS